MNDDYLFWICIIVSVIGLIILIGLILFGTILMNKSIFKTGSDSHYWQEILFHINKNDLNNYRDLSQQVHSGYTEYLQRRNEFWTVYGQIIIAVLIAIVLTILLLTKTISPEAGLPILSGISGFAIAKSVSNSNSQNMPRDRNKNFD